VTVNLTAFSRGNVVEIHSVVNVQLASQKTTGVSVPKLTACGTNTQTILDAINTDCTTRLTLEKLGSTSPKTRITV
jgi:hypothetical protein